VAEKMYKSVAAANPSEMRKVIDMQIEDGKKMNNDFKKIMQLSKTAKYKNRGVDGASKELSNVEIIDKTHLTHSYSHMAGRVDRKVQNFNAEDFKTESDQTVFGRNRTKYEQLDPTAATVDESQFNANDSGERHIAPMGKKSRARRYAATDGVTNELNG